MSTDSKTPAKTPAPSKPAVLSLDSVRHRKSKKQAATKPAAETVPASPKQPESAAPNPARPTEDKRLANRASLVATFAALKGVDVPAQDLIELFKTQSLEDFGAPTLTIALRHIGLAPRARHKVKPQPSAWPAFACMNNGQWILVLSQTADTLTIHDSTCADHQAEVPLEEFAPFFTGTILGARVPLAQLAARHAPGIGRGHWFWGEFTRYRRQMGEIMLGSLVANLLAVSVALFSLQVYDRVIPHQSEATLWVLAGGALIAVLLEGALKLARARLTDAAGRQIELSVQARLMRRLLGMRADKRPMAPSGLFAAMRDFGSVREFFTSSTLSTLADVPFIAVFLLLVASIAGPIVWALILGGILMVLPAYFMQRKMIALTRQTQGASAKASRLLQEVVIELETVKSQRGEARVLRLWDELNELSSQSSAGQRKLSAALTHWSQGVQQATYISAVILGTYMVFKGEFTVGTIIATGILTSRTLAPLTQFASTLARWSNVKAALEALDAIAEAPQESVNDRSMLRRPKLTGQFELRELSYRYSPDGAPVLDVQGIAINAGQSVAILGANGSGKSTLLKLLAGLYTPDSGRVMLDGTGMEQIDPRDLRRGIGYLGQDVRLFAGTLRDNLNLSMLEQDNDRLMAALDFAGMGPFVRSHPKGLDLEIGDGGAGLSQGQRQSIGWAQLWLQDPAIVLLDEPTAALDQTLERTLISRLETWLHGRTSIIATHRMPIVALTHRTLILQAGRMVVDGPRDQVLAHLAAGDSK